MLSILSSVAGDGNKVADPSDPDHSAPFYIKPVDSNGYALSNTARIQDKGM